MTRPRVCLNAGWASVRSLTLKPLLCSSVSMGNVSCATVSILWLLNMQSGSAFMIPNLLDRKTTSPLTISVTFLQPGYDGLEWIERKSRFCEETGEERPSTSTTESTLMSLDGNILHSFHN